MLERGCALGGSVLVSFSTVAIFYNPENSSLVSALAKNAKKGCLAARVKMQGLRLEFCINILEEQKCMWVKNTVG